MSQYTLPTGWWKESISDKGYDRLYDIWATDFNACSRNVQYQVHNIPKAPKHYYPYRGSLIHKVIENLLNGETPNVYPSEFPDQADHIINKLQPLKENMTKWIKTTKIDLTKCDPEVKYQYNMGDGFKITRKIDLLSDIINLDFKSRSGRNVSTARKYERWGVAVGWWCAYQDDGVERENVMVFLGGEYPVEVNPFGPRATLEKALEGIWEKYEEIKEKRRMIEDGHLMYTQYSGFCGMCDYRHICRGI